MQQDETIIGNKIIAEFMGYYFSGDKFYSRDAGRGNWFKEAKYHTSWDWLMPVVEKIEGMGYMTIIGASAAFGGHYMNIMTGIKMPNDTLENPTKFMGAEDTKLATIYSAVIQFIKWHNQNQTPELLNQPNT